jgi:hypothetical protein
VETALGDIETLLITLALDTINEPIIFCDAA